MLKLHAFKFSQPARSVMLLLEASKIPYQFHSCDVFKGENRKPEFLKISPTGLVPVIQEPNGFVLSEASAILTYLCESRQLSQWFSADNVETRAKVNFWLSWHHHNSRYSTKYLLHSKLFPKLAGSEENYKLGQKHMTKTCKFMNSALSSQRYLGGPSASIADLLVITELDQHQSDAFNLWDYSEYPHVTRWMADVRNAVGSEVYDSAYKPVQEVGAKMQLKK